MTPVHNFSTSFVAPLLFPMSARTSMDLTSLLIFVFISFIPVQFPFTVGGLLYYALIATWKLTTNYLLMQVPATPYLFIIASVSFSFLVMLSFILNPLFSFQGLVFINSQYTYILLRIQIQIFKWFLLCLGINLLFWFPMKPGVWFLSACLALQKKVHTD